jgi:hypothetical protein
MKKSILILSILMMLPFLASAQFFKFGIKGGMNYSTLNFDEVKSVASGNASYDLMSDESFQGFHVGVMTRLKVWKIFLQPELYFNTSGGAVLVEQVAGGTLQEVKNIKYSRVDLPIMLGLKFGPLRVNGGPVFSTNLSSENEIQEIIPELETLSKSATIGMQVGAGLDILKFLTLDYRFESGLSKWGEEFTIGGTSYPFDSRANMHLISLGILF